MFFIHQKFVTAFSKLTNHRFNGYNALMPFIL